MKIQISGTSHPKAEGDGAKPATKVSMTGASRGGSKDGPKKDNTQTEES